MARMDQDQNQLVIWRRQVFELVERQRVRPARDVLRQALARFPEDKELLLGAAWVAYLDDQSEEAEQLCEQLLRQDPGSAEGRSLLAKVFAERGKLIEAETLYRSLMRDFPSDVTYTADFATMLTDTVHLDQAHELARRAIKMAPDHLGARRAIVLTSLLRGEHEHVETTLAQMMESDPQAAETLHSLVFVLDERGDKAGALRLAQEMLRANPDNPALVRYIIELQHASHWSMRPLRWLDADAFALAGVAMFGLGLLTLADHPVAHGAGVVLCAYGLYGALWPPLLRRLQR